MFALIGVIFAWCLVYAMLHDNITNTIGFGFLMITCLMRSYVGHILREMRAAKKESSPAKKPAENKKTFTGEFKKQWAKEYHLPFTKKKPGDIA